MGLLAAGVPATTEKDLELRLGGWGLPVRTGLAVSSAWWPPGASRSCFDPR
ncbi:MAG TPA: hypothetical protein VL242_09630 [Sorangium sp.]|nr:hypothetical protein [Sorangium sp.]